MERSKNLICVIALAMVLSGCSGVQSETSESVVESTIASNSAAEIKTGSENLDTTESSTSEITEKEKIIPAEYYTVIDSIISCVESYDPNIVNTYIGNDYGDGVCELCSNENVKDLVAFAFVDIDDDNISELLILDCGYVSDYQYRIIDLYSFSDDDVKHVFGGGIRCRYYLSKDMEIYSEGSSGALYLISTKYLYDSELHDLKFVEAYYTIPIKIGSDDEDLMLCYTADKSYILSDDIESSSVEIIDSVAGSSQIFEEYGVNKAGLFDYGAVTVTTLTEYCKN